jgi:hypothetical protein
MGDVLRASCSLVMLVIAPSVAVGKDNATSHIRIIGGMACCPGEKFHRRQYFASLPDKPDGSDRRT